MSWDCFGCFGGCGSVWRRLTGVLGTFDGCWGRLLGVLRAFEGVWDVFWGVGDVLGALGGVGGFWEPLTPHCTPNIPLRPFTPPNTQLHTKMLTNTSLHPITPQTPHYTPKHQFTPSKQPIILQKKTLYPKALPKHHLTPPLTLGLLYTLTTPNPGQGSTLAKRIYFDCLVENMGALRRRKGKTLSKKWRPFQCMQCMPFGWTETFRKAEQISIFAMKEPLPSFINKLIA